MLMEEEKKRKIPSNQCQNKNVNKLEEAEIPSNQNNQQKDVNKELPVPADRRINSKQIAEKAKNLANILSKTPTKKIVPPTKPTISTAITKKNITNNKTPIKLIKISR